MVCFVRLLLQSFIQERDSSNIGITPMIIIMSYTRMELCNNTNTYELTKQSSFTEDEAMADQSNRMKSYRKYESLYQNTNSQEIMMLIADGFYFNHDKSCVVCYYCLLYYKVPFDCYIVLNKHKQGYCPEAKADTDKIKPKPDKHQTVNEKLEFSESDKLEEWQTVQFQYTDTSTLNDLKSVAAGANVSNISTHTNSTLPSISKEDNVANNNYTDRIPALPDFAPENDEMCEQFSQNLEFDFSEDDSFYEEAAHPNFTSYNIRLATFRRWPDAIAVRPPELAEAGFYFTGMFDNVKCFFCDGGIRNFSPTDKAWDDHAKWYPNCKFLIEKQGQGFVDEVQEKRRREEEEKKRQAVPPIVNSGTIVKSTKYPRLEKDVLESDTVKAYIKSLTELGYVRNVVKDTIVERFRATGKIHENLDLLIADLMRKEAQGVTVISKDSSTNAKKTKKTKRKNKSKAKQSNSSQHNVKTTGSASLPHESASSSDDSCSFNSPPSDSGYLSENSEASITLDKLNAEREDLLSRKLCIICVDAPRDTVMLPCAHLNTCAGCAAKVDNCPLCRKWIKGTVKVFL